jgi:hypothetical protein
MAVVGMLLLLGACSRDVREPTAPERTAKSLTLADRGGTDLNSRFPISFTVDNPCTPDIESIQLEGEEHLVLRSSFDNTGTEHLGLHFNVHLTGSDGQGVTYTENLTHNADGTMTPDEDLVFQARDLMRLVSGGAAPNFMMTVVFRIFRDGTILFDPGEVLCRG